MWFREIAALDNPGRPELQSFVDRVIKFLHLVLEDDEFAFLWRDAPELRSQARETFDRDVVESARDLRNAIPQIADAILVQHGLIGRPARFKFRVLNTVANLWERVRGQLGVGKWFKRIIEAIDAILGSLIDASGGIGSILKEFKDALSALADTQE